LLYDIINYLKFILKIPQRKSLFFFLLSNIFSTLALPLSSKGFKLFLPIW